MTSPILDVGSTSFACLQIHGEPVQTIAARAGGKTDKLLAKDDVIAMLGSNTAAQAAGYTDDIHHKLLAALQQHAGESLNFPSLWNPSAFTTIKCQANDAQSNVAIVEALYPVEDPAKGFAHRGVMLEPKRFIRFSEVDSKDGAAAQQVGIAFDNKFPSGRMGNVLQTGPTTFTIVTSPENAPPINDSPWYAFRVHNPAGKQRAITLEFAYEGALHRYLPKISYDGITWQAITPHLVARNGLVDDGSWGDGKSKGYTASFSLVLNGRTVWVAAQELVTSDHIEDWAKKMVATHPYITMRSVGTSHGGRSIPLLEINKGKTVKPTVVIIGRQHPPEVTGSLAQMQFVEALCDDSKLSAQFLAKFNVIVMPNLNPDGVDQGHWRHNGIGPCTDTDNDGRCEVGKGGVDLNRDWQAFNEPETRAAKAVLEATAKTGIAFFMDFHSTYKDVMYVVQLNDKAQGRAALDSRVLGWIDRLSQREKDYHYNLIPYQRSDPISAKTSCGWMDKTFGVPTVTYEVGDQTPRGRLATLARSAAYALIEHLL